MQRSLLPDLSSIIPGAVLIFTLLGDTFTDLLDPYRADR